MGVRLESAPLRKELRWLGLTLAGLLVAIAFEHFVIQRDVIQPTLRAAPTVPLWMLGALFLPEMTVCVVSGWRIRQLTWLAIYALAAGVLRETVFHLLRLAPTLDRPEDLIAHGLSFGRGALLVAVMYFLVFGLASMTAREPGPVPNR